MSPDELLQLAETLRVKPGERSLATRAALAERDRLVRELAATCFPGLTRNQQAEAIHVALSRYHAGAWRRECSDPECRHAATDRRALLWQILKARPHVPAPRTINGILR
ncbi:hypothetical protein AB7M49_006610 [Bradyrhizobium elkanii]